jgi:hypothetical protein
MRTPHSTPFRRSALACAHGAAQSPAHHSQTQLQRLCCGIVISLAAAEHHAVVAARWRLESASIARRDAVLEWIFVCIRN